jgi:hypothetical protein
MGTRTNSTDTEKVKPSKCSLCNQEYTPVCDYRQGRCPHHSSWLDNILSDPYKSRFYNLLKFLKGNK